MNHVTKRLTSKGASYNDLNRLLVTSLPVSLSHCRTQTFTNVPTPYHLNSIVRHEKWRANLLHYGREYTDPLIRLLRSYLLASHWNHQSNCGLSCSQQHRSIGDL